MRCSQAGSRRARLVEAGATFMCPYAQPYPAQPPVTLLASRCCSFVHMTGYSMEEVLGHNW